MDRKPNILWIVSDAHQADLAGFAGNDVVDTTALNFLASQARRFNRAYCQTPDCTQSRMSMLTGRLPIHCGGFDPRSVIADDAITLPAWLSKHGYVTAAIGRLGLNGSDRGFGFQHRPYGDLLSAVLPARQPDPPESAVENAWLDHARGRLHLAGESQIPESLQVDRVVATEALAWMLEAQARFPDQPWFCFVGFSRPQFPLTAPGRYLRRAMDTHVPLPVVPAGYPDELHPFDRQLIKRTGVSRLSMEQQELALAAYLASIDYMDDCLGYLLASLWEQGQLDHTCTFYTSDHGEMAGRMGMWWAQTWRDAAARVPLLIAGPDVVRDAGVDQPVELVDLFPTTCELAGIPTPAGLDGESLVPQLTSGEARRRRPYARTISVGSSPEHSFRAVRDRRHTWVDYPRYQAQLFDRDADPDECVDLIASPPDPTGLDKLRQTGAEMGDWASLHAARDAARQNAGPMKIQTIGATQYRLADGRYVEADAGLFPVKLARKADRP